ncbi:hypothetical protein CHS0354_006896 [Potamilus streckersoni]|uniref:N-acetyltransferase domain-containing protein n=1 Tax=Potamilus streckersoni TaxID=2493646 RepID=A0AAE0TEC5_9BIVA|nr:hypothetical protein CHS0354_006896 [Potamilus streckersoni]
MVVFTVLFSFGFLLDFMVKASKKSTAGIDASVIIGIIGNTLNYIGLILSFIFFLSAVITVIKLNNSFELVGIRSGGISDKRISRPFFLLALFVSLFFIINDSYFIRLLAPEAQSATQKSEWSLNKNLLIFHPDRADNPVDTFAVALSNHNRFSGVYKADNTGNQFYLDAGGLSSSEKDLLAINEQINKKLPVIPPVVLKNYGTLGLETLIHIAVKAEISEQKKALFTLTRKICAILLFFVYTVITVLLSNMPVRRASWLIPVMIVIMGWLFTMLGRLMGENLFKTGRLDWFMSASFEIWFALILTAIVYLYQNRHRYYSIFLKLPTVTQPCAHMELSVRSVREQDIARITEIYNYYILNSAYTFETEPITPAVMAERIAKLTPNYPYLVGEFNGQTVAYAYAGTYHERAAYRCTVQPSIYIDHHFTGKGIGSALYRTLIEEVGKSPVYYSMLALISIPNAPSIKLHRTFGFEERGQIKSAGFKSGKYYDVALWQLMLRQ